MADLVLTEPQEGGVVVLRLNSPPMNALSKALLGELRDAARAITADPSIKAVVEALGVPHPEIDLLIVHGRFVDFAARVQDGDRIAVYPRLQTLDPGEGAISAKALGAATLHQEKRPSSVRLNL